MKLIGETGGSIWDAVVGGATVDSGESPLMRVARRSVTIGPLERAYHERAYARRHMEAIRRVTELLTGEVVAVYDDDGRIDLHYADGRIVSLRSTGYEDTGIDVSATP